MDKNFILAKVQSFNILSSLYEVLLHKVKRGGTAFSLFLRDFYLLLWQKLNYKPAIQMQTKSILLSMFLAMT
ncbi:MAG: hypothetical protein ACI3Y5_08755, partial [Prevotella sp.]